MKISVKQQDVYKISQKFPSPEMYEVITNLFGERAKSFARFETGAGVLQWSFDGNDWHKLSDADSLEEQDVRAAIIELKDDVRKILSGAKVPINVENLCTTPSSEYIFYKYNGNRIDVVLAAWDYKFPAHISVGNINLKGPKKPDKQNVVITLLEAGTSCAYRDFTFQTLSNRTKIVKTDDQGHFCMGELFVGKEYFITDPETNKSFTIHPESGKEEYVFDLSKDMSLTVNVKKDGKPLYGEPVVIELDGTVLTSTTNVDGSAVIPFSYTDSRTCVLKCCGKADNVQLDYPDTSIDLAYETPHFEISVYVGRNGSPLPAEPVSIVVGGGNPVNLNTKDDGFVTTSVPYSPTIPVEVKVRDLQQLRYSDMNGLSFSFEITERDRKKLKVQVVEQNGMSMPSYPVNVVVAGVTSNGLTDIDGMFDSGLHTIGDTIEIVDGNNLVNKVSYIINSDQDVYTLRVSKAPERVLSLNFISMDGKPIADKDVILTQKDKRAVIHLDSAGNAEMSREIFDFGEKVATSIVFDGVETSPFDVSFDRDEDEYLFEYNHKYKKPWLRNLLMALLISAMSIICLFFIFFLCI